MKLQRLYSYTRQALDNFHMIQEGDRIALGLSGGKDSTTLLYALAGLRRFYPVSFEIVAITVNLGYEGFQVQLLRQLCEELQVEYHVVDTSICDIISEKENRDSPCSLCARLRKGALNERALELGCNKVAYAHHKDDAVETMMLSLLFEGRFCSFWPVTKLEKTGLTLIRPMLYVSEAEVVGFWHKTEFPIVKNLCPFDGHTKRQYVKDLLKQMNQEHPGVKERMFHALEIDEHWSALKC